MALLEEQPTTEDNRMMNEETIQKLLKMKMSGMANAYKQQAE